jgi:hypothetical protein
VRSIAGKGAFDRWALDRTWPAIVRLRRDLVAALKKIEIRKFFFFFFFFGKF